jgi:hypothetical protein
MASHLFESVGILGNSYCYYIVKNQEINKYSTIKWRNGKGSRIYNLDLETLYSALVQNFMMVRSKLTFFLGFKTFYHGSNVRVGSPKANGSFKYWKVEYQ